LADLSLGEGRMAKTKYGIKVPMAVDDYVWVCTVTAPHDPQPVLYETRAAALEAAEIWGPLARVETYPVDNN